LPLADEQPRTTAGGPVHEHDGHDQADDHACDCRDGSRPPCAGCLRRPPATATLSPRSP
jgi:hypothetical protein